MGFWSKLKSAFKKVAAVALPVVAIFAPALIPAIGAAILPAGASAVAATAAGSAVITTAGQLAAGASPEQAIKAGAVAGITMGVGGTVAASQGVAAGSVAGSAAGTVVAGGTPQDVLRNAVSAGVGAGVGETTGSATLGKAAGTLAVTGGNVQAAINSVVNSELGNLAKMGVEKYTTTADQQMKQAAADVEKNIAAAKAIPGTQLAQADTGTVSDIQTLPEVVVTAPAPKPDAIDVMPYLQTEVSKTAPTPSAKTEPAKPVEPTVAPTSDKAPVAQEPAKEEAKPTEAKKPTLSPIYFTGVAPASATPLAQGLGTTISALPTTGLTAERGAGEIESKETGKARQNVWNEASLRLKDALGV